MLQHLLSPIDIGPIVLPNRVIVTGHATLYNQGTISDREIAYHVRRAQGGVALTTVAAASIHPSGERANVLDNLDDSVLPGFRKLASAVHQHGGRVMIQFSHAAALTAPVHGELPRWAPSQVMGEFGRALPHVMTLAEIGLIVESYRAAASRVRTAGLDGVELSAHVGTLPIAFLSPYTNKRHDLYGGSFENRLRFLVEVAQACREALGPTLALALKVSGDEFVEGGLHLPDIQNAVRRLDELHLIDYYVVSSGNNMERFARVTHWPPTPAPHGLHANLARGIREVSSRPVAALSRIVDLQEADRMISDGTCDLVAMVRATIADPDIVKKALEDRMEDIRPCVGANTGCVDRILEGQPMRCIYNPVTGRELEWESLSPPSSRKRVAVIGGGPGGLEAARVCAERGHTVVLYERSADLGGQARLAAQQPGRGEMIGIVRWLSDQVKRAGIEVNLGVNADVRTVMAWGPDEVIVATGSEPTEPTVTSRTIPVVSAHAILSGSVRLGSQVVIVDHTGKQIGCAVAELIADGGGAATVVSRHFHPAIDFGLTNTISLYARLFTKRVELIAHHDLKSINENSAVLMNCFSGVERSIDGIDLVVMVTDPKPNDHLIASLHATGLRVHPVGDCLAPRDIESATYEGHAAALSI